MKGFKMIKRYDVDRLLGIFLGVFLCVCLGTAPNVSVFAAEDASNGVRIEKVDQRTKASIPAGDSGDATRQNFAQKGVSTLCHGIYHGGKVVADGVGTGLDFTIDAMRKAGRKVFDWVTLGKLGKKKTA